jgi:hypothetical protein
MPRWAWAITSASVGTVRLASSPPLPLRLLHSPSNRVQLWRVGGQPLDHQPAALAGDERLHGLAAVGGQAIPPQGGLLPAEEASQLAEHPDQGVGVVAAGLQVEAKLAATAAHPIAQGGSHRRALPVERMDQQWRLPTRRPRRAHAGGQAHTRLVKEADDGAATPGVFLILGQSV